MQTRRDQVQAYFFVVGRMVAALTHGRPDLRERPNRRQGNGVVLGLLVAALIVAVFGVYGVFSPGGSSAWRKPGVIVVEKDTGARYLYVDGQLRPVLNYASARLAVARPDAPLVAVSRASLAGVPLGTPIGIPNAPDSLPPAGRLAGRPWTVCVTSPGVGPGLADSAPATPTVTLRLDQVDGGVPLGDRGLLVAAPDGGEHLLWRGRRFRLADADAARALGYGAVQPLAVPASWLDPIPAGPDLAAPTIDGIGQSGPSVGGRPSLVGQVFQVRDRLVGSEQLYVARADGLAPLSRTQAALLLATPGVRAAYPNGGVAPVQVGPDALSGVPLRPAAALGGGAPATPPAPMDVPQGASVCAWHALGSAAESAAALALLPTQVVTAGTTAVDRRGGDGTADRIAIDAGGGVLAAQTAAPGAPPGAVYLVAGPGVRYPLADTSVAGVLGYSGVTPLAAPAALLALLPQGPTLSTAAALQNRPAQGS